MTDDDFTADKIRRIEEAVRDADLAREVEKAWITAGSDPATCEHWFWKMNFPKFPPRWLPAWAQDVVLNGPILHWWSRRIYFTCTACGKRKV